MDKIHLLRNYYSAERPREDGASKKSCSVQNDLYTSKWLFFNLVSKKKLNTLSNKNKLKTTSNGHYAKS